MKNEDAGPTDEQRAELSEDRIGTADIPEVLDWTHARRADPHPAGQAADHPAAGR